MSETFRNMYMLLVMNTHLWKKKILLNSLGLLWE